VRVTGEITKKCREERMYNESCKAARPRVEEASGLSDIKHSETENRISNAGALI
jgi:hypothetical protein